jgi:tRNA pseudouridine38-40 synthase
MQQAATHLLGEHDFNAFRAASCQAPSSVRTLTDIRLTRSVTCIAFDVRGNAFLHHMIRNIMGTLVKVGKGEADPEWVAEVLKLRDRRLSGMTAPAHGLYFVDVVYPQDYGLPTSAAPVLPTTGELCF